MKRYVLGVTSSPPPIEGGFLSQGANSRFSFEQSIDSSISELSPCAPRFFFIHRLCHYDPHAFLSYIDRGIEIPIVMAFAVGQSHSRMPRSFVSGFLYPHTEQVWLEGNHLSIRISCFPSSSSLYFRKVVNMPHPLSWTDLPKCSDLDPLFLPVSGASLHVRQLSLFPFQFLFQFSVIARIVCLVSSLLSLISLYCIFGSLSTEKLCFTIHLPPIEVGVFLPIVDKVFDH